MLPPKTDACWKDLVTGRIQAKFKTPALAMCIARNQRMVKQNPENAQLGVDEIFGFCTKYTSLIEDDIKIAFATERV